MDCSQESANTISEARWTYQDLVGHYDYAPRVDVERVVIIRLPKDDEWDKAKNKPERIHEMLATLLSNKIEPADKLKTLNQDFHIPLTETIQEEVDKMCNYSTAIRYEGRIEGREEGRIEGREEGRIETSENNARCMIRAGKLTTEEISLYSGLPINRIKELETEEKQNA